MFDFVAQPILCLPSPFLMPPRYTYTKTEKLKSRKKLQNLFVSGSTISNFPVKVFYKKVAPSMLLNNVSLQIGVGVSTKKIKTAVARNRVKRLLRECVRLNKYLLYEQSPTTAQPFVLFFLYVDNTLPTLNLLQNSFDKIIPQLLNKLYENKSSTIN